MNSPDVTPDVLIVGAGLSGLTAARELQSARLRVVLLDKGRSPGGRLATRRIGQGRADHGAQFFTTRSSEFQDQVDHWLQAGLVYQWSRGWSDGSLMTAPSDGHPRYAVHGGMNALARHLARGLDLHVNVRLVEATSTNKGWQVSDETGRVYSSQALLLTPPVPQSLALLEAGGVVLAGQDRTVLESIDYGPCLAGLFWLDRASRLPEPGAVQRTNAPIPWIADNQRKGISPDATVVTVHAAPQISESYWDALEQAVLDALQAGLQPFLASDTQVVERQLKRWRYAIPTTLNPERTLLARDLPPLAFAGDAFGSPRVEGAFLSGMAAARALAGVLKTAA